MSSRPVTAWLFGKMPTHGDFVSRGLSPARRVRLDMWLTDEMNQSRARYGEGFEAVFETAPPWRFANQESDADWEGGALCASVDSAGRCFPLIVGRVAIDAAQATIAANACETAIYRAFADRLSADELWEAAANEPPIANNHKATSGWWTDGNDNFPARRLTDALPVGLIATMLEARADG